MSNSADSRTEHSTEHGAERSAVAFDAQTNVAVAGGETLVFHCHYYNCALHRAIEDGMGLEAERILKGAAARTLERQMREFGPDRAGIEENFRAMGFGVLELSGVEATGGVAVVHGSHYAMGWTALHGERQTPVCHFPAGYIQGAFSALYDIDLKRVSVTETTCYAIGAPECRFLVEVI